MSKIGQKPVTIPQSVQTAIADNKITVTGKEGTLSVELPKGITIVKDNDTLLLKRTNDSKQQKALHGLFRSLVANAVVGVDTPWEKRLEVVGTGFNVKLQGEDLVFKVGYSHPVVFKKVDGVKYAVEGNNKVVLKSRDKQLVGEIAYKVKMIRKPDVYKGKGIKYAGEKLRIKPGKKAKTTA
jgi:large subunit ribosomal protein L6